MEFQNPLILLFIPIVLLIIVPLFILSNRRNSHNIKKFIGNNSDTLLPKRNRYIKIVKFIIILISLILLIISLARPQKGFITKEITTSGIDIVIAIDTSKSMDAIDVTPNRLLRAKMALLELSNNLMGDRIALIPFAGSSFVMTPFTADYTVFNQSVESLNTDIIPKGGTNLKSAIKTANDLFKNNSNQKILILITDGEDLAKKGIDEAKKVADKGVQIFTVGVGTTDGELIPDSNSKDGYLKDKSGNLVKSRLDENSLKNIASVTGGSYRHLLSGGNGILEIYKKNLEALEDSDKVGNTNREPIDHYKPFLLIAIILISLELILSNILTKIRKKTVLTLLFLINITSLFATQADDAFKNGDYLKAIELYQKERPSPETLYNLGTAYYRTENYDQASKAFKESLKKASGELQKKILYNLGNSYYRESTKIDDINTKIELLEKSLKNYKGSMELKNSDDQVKNNYNFVKEILDKLKQDQENQDDQNKDDQNKDEQNKDDQSQDEQNQDEQNQDEQNQDEQNQDEQNQDEQSQDEQSQDEQSQDEQSQDEQSQDEQNQDQHSQDEQNQDEQSQDEQSQDENSLTKAEAEALLKALESEDVKFQILQNNHDNSYTGEW